MFAHMYWGLFIRNYCFFSHTCIFLMMNNNQGSQTQPFLWFISLHYWSCPCGLERDTEPLSCQWLRASTKCLRCKITVLPSLMSLGYSGVWRRTMTQSVWGDDICPVRTDREKKKRRVRAGLLKAASQNIMLQLNRERWEERLMGWVKGKQLQHRDSLFLESG